MPEVSRRTFSNYFAGKAECVLAVTEGWLDDVLDAVRTAPPDRALDDVLCAALDRVATDLSLRWERLFVIMQGAPELEAMAGAMDAAIAARLCSAIAGRLDVPADDVRIRMFAAYALLAGGSVSRTGSRRDGPPASPVSTVSSSSPCRSSTCAR